MRSFPLSLNASTAKFSVREESFTNNYRKLAFAALFAACLIFSASSSTVYAATFVVNSTVDAIDITAGNGVCETATGNGVCTLRAAITEANSLVGADIITLPAGTYTETLTAAGENVNAGGDFDITSDITINGAGAASTIVQANAAAGVATERVFHIRGAAAATALTVVLDGLTVQNGRNNANIFGGGIRIDQGTNHNVTIRNSTVTNNLNDSSGGGLSISTAITPTVTITNSTFSNNRAGSATAGTSATGGGIQVNAAATVNITNTTITGNTATTALTAINPSGGGLSIAAGITTVTNSTINNNTASSTTAGSASSTFGGGVSLSGGTGTFTGSTISNNASTATNGTGSGFAGGIYNQQATLNLTNSTLSGNTSSNFHGGIRALASTILTTTNITNSTISNNSAPGEGGGVVNFSVGAANAIVNVTGSAIVGNSGGSGVGGGIENFSNSTGLATVNLNNSTVGGNNAANGAGVYNTGGTSSINLQYSTVASNTATTNGGGLFQDATGTTNLSSSIVADNTAGTGPDIFGLITSLGYNHVENTAGGTFPIANSGGNAPTAAGDVTGVDPVLTALALNGGTTLNYQPSPRSPVLDTIPTGTNGCGTAPFNIDQRGLARPTDSNLDTVPACEKGAVETLFATAAAVSVGGRVTTANGSGIRNVRITLTDLHGISRTATTGTFGSYQFDNVNAGETYVIRAAAKKYTFNQSSQVVSVTDSLTGLNFTAVK